jgi:hypothetical protein
VIVFDENFGGSAFTLMGLPTEKDCWYQVTASFKGVDLKGMARQKPVTGNQPPSVKIIGSLDVSTGIRLSGTLIFRESGVIFDSVKSTITIPGKGEVVINKRGSRVPWDVLLDENLEILHSRLSDSYAK